MKHLPILVLVAVLVGCRALDGTDVAHLSPEATGEGPRILCVVAHPDDEIAFAGTVYKTTTFLDGVCDLVTITNGEGGFKYATLAEPLYGLELTDEEVGRRHLPAIRRRELIEGCRILGFRDIHFLGERDHRYTTNPAEILGEGVEVWDLPSVLARLDDVLRAGHYDYVFTLLPTPTTHGHHQAATILALTALEALPADARPVAFGVETWQEGEEAAAPFVVREGYPLTHLAAGSGPFRFDRTLAFGHRDQLSYKIIANWAIAAHRSQGTMQLLMNRGDEERYYPFALTAPADFGRVERFFSALAARQFPVKTYGPSAGTNAGGS